MAFITGHLTGCGKNLGNWAVFSSQIVRQKRPIVRQKWSIMRQIVRFFTVIIIVLEEKKSLFFLSTSNLICNMKNKVTFSYFYKVPKYDVIIFKFLISVLSILYAKFCAGVCIKSEDNGI